MSVSFVLVGSAGGARVELPLRALQIDFSGKPVCVTTGLVTIAFLAAIERIPLGTAVAIEFLGPLTVAAVRCHNRRALGWPALALVGVVLLTEPWQGDIDAAGVGFAALAAIGWAAYILLTQRVGDRFTGLGGLTITVPSRRGHRRGRRNPASPMIKASMAWRSGRGQFCLRLVPRQPTRADQLAAHPADRSEVPRRTADERNPLRDRALL